MTENPDKHKKKNKIEAKQSSNIKNLDTKARKLICQLMPPSLTIENNVSITFEGVIVLRNPLADFKPILGEIRCNMDSFTGKL